MDAFHTLAAGRLIEATADNTTLIPFTWAICRLFNALILVTGVSLLMVKEKRETGGDDARLPIFDLLGKGLQAFFRRPLCR
jgi:hypothetical protein